MTVRRSRRLLKDLDDLYAEVERMLDAVRTVRDLVRQPGITGDPSATRTILAQALALDATRRQATPRRRRGKATGNIRAQRAKSAAYLARFDTNTPRASTGKNVGVYVRRGYLVKANGGYLRTAKAYRI